MPDHDFIGFKFCLPRKIARVAENPLRFLAALVFSKSWAPIENAEIHRRASDPEKRPLRKRFTRRLSHVLQAHLGDAALQLVGMIGLVPTLHRTLGWTFRLMHGRIERSTVPPRSEIPMRAPDGGPASHALPGTPHSTGTAASQADTAASR